MCRLQMQEGSVESAQQQAGAMLIVSADSPSLASAISAADLDGTFVSIKAISSCNMSADENVIEVAVNTLSVRDVVVCGQYHVGIEKGARTSNACHEGGDVPCLSGDVSMGVCNDSVAALSDEQSVLSRVNELMGMPELSTLIDKGAIRLHAWVLCKEAGEVKVFDRAANRFVPMLEVTGFSMVEPGDRDALRIKGAKEGQASSLDATPKWLQVIQRDLPASLVVFAVALPLCVAIAKASEVPTAAGIITAIVGGVVVGRIGGGPLQVSGPTAGLIAVVLGVQEQLGFASLGVVVVLAGLMQIAAGMLRLGQWFRAVSPAVILGMLAGIGMGLVVQQFHVALDDAPRRSAFANLLGVPRAVVDIVNGHSGHEGHVYAAVVGLLTLAVLLLWKRIVPLKIKGVPSVLAAVVIATVTVGLLDLPVQRVEFDSLASSIQFVGISSLPGMLKQSALWQAAIAIAILASAESLLTASAVDGMHTGDRTRYDRELAAQGVGNALCGMVGALPMAGVIVRSSANLEAGAASRWSSVFHGIWMLAFVLFAPGVLRLIPVSALAATLVLTGFRLIQLPAMRALWRESKSEGGICLVVAATVVAVDLLTGVLVGIGLTLCKLLYAFSRLCIRQHQEIDNGATTMELEGSATFLRLPKLADALESVPPNTTLHVDLKNLRYIDHTCLTLLMNWEKQHEATGGKLVLDWDLLRAQFHTDRPKSEKAEHLRSNTTMPGQRDRVHRKAA